jgi:hypothetical protein
MATSKFAPALTIKKSDLPVTCNLLKPPASVTIALAQFFDATGTAITLGISASGQSFVIPNTIGTGSGTLEVRIIGGDPKNFVPVDVVEDTTPPLLILSIQDPVSKFAVASVAVLP